MSDEQLNTAIDEVARQITADAPPDGAAFRRRVLARIDGKEVDRSPFGVRRSTFGVRGWELVATVAAALVVAVFVARRPQKAIPSAPDRTAAPVTLPPRSTGLEASAFAPADVPRVSTRLAAAQAPRALGAEAAAARPEPNAVASIAVSPIAVAPLAVDTLTQESIEIPQLEVVAPMTVAPLDINDSSRRNP
jgi:hypothetical protein